MPELTFTLAGFWGQQCDAFFIYRAFHPNVQSYYSDHIREVELTSFTPLVFATTGDMGKGAITFHHRLASSFLNAIPYPIAAHSSAAPHLSPY